MAAALLTANVQRPCRVPVGGIYIAEMPMVGYTTLTTILTAYHGSLMVNRAANGPGYVRTCPLTATTNIASGDVFSGMALERQDITANDTVDGAKKITVARNGVWGFPVNSIGRADIGKPAYATDDGSTITTTSTNALWLGTIEDVDATYVWVNIATAFGRLTSAVS